MNSSTPSTPVASAAASATSVGSSTSSYDASQHASPIVAFIIGFGIILLASVLNAAGLNLTKLDHVRTSSIPKAARRQDWLRPLWLLGMVLYVLSQLLGSTLALDYMRAEYVAPLGSASLIFNFLFARFLVGTPVTKTDIQGTIVVVLGVIGIVAFGNINSGLSSETDVEHLTALWRRGGWLVFFFCMSVALIMVLIFTYSLDAVLAARSDIDSEPLSGATSLRMQGSRATFLAKVKLKWRLLMAKIRERLEVWTAPQDDNRIAWVLGIGWGCCGGGLAGGCLVFAKATVKLLTGSLSHENPGNQFGHVAPIFTIVLLAVTAVLQIICLNRGLKAYDSTLVVPVFYGVYTATGFLDSLIFNNEVDSYKPWTLFLIFGSILLLISGVVLLTSKEPERSKHGPGGLPVSTTFSRGGAGSTIKVDGRADGSADNGDPSESALRSQTAERTLGGMWQVGDMSDEEDDCLPGQHHARRGVNASRVHDFAGSEESSRLISDEEDLRH